MSGNALNRRFDYDPIYRLLSATGRECDRPPEGEPWDDRPRCTDLTKARAYTERYHYDAMGNMLRLDHRNDANGFTRKFTVEAANNRLWEMKVGEAPTTTPSTPTATCARRPFPATSSGTTPIR